MTSPREKLPAPRRVISATSENPSIKENASPATTQPDPMIAKGLQREQYIGIFGVAVGLILIIGYFSRRIEYALIFAFFLSLIIIVFFLTV